MQCQGYHVCLASQFAPGIADRKMSFLCPNGTVFSQALFTCDWWYVANTYKLYNPTLFVLF